MKFFQGFIMKDFAKERYLAIVRNYPRLREEKTQIYMMLSLTFLSLSFLGIFAINPTLTTIVELNKKIADSEFTNDALKTKVTNLSSLYQQYQAMTSVWPLVDAAIPDDPKAAYLLGQIQAIARDTGVNIKTLQTAQIELTKTAKGHDLAYDFDITATGNTENLIQFTKALSGFDRVISIDNIALSQKDLSDITIHGRAFYLP